MTTSNIEELIKNYILKYKPVLDVISLSLKISTKYNLIPGEVWNIIEELIKKKEITKTEAEQYYCWHINQSIENKYTKDVKKKTYFEKAYTLIYDYFKNNANNVSQISYGDIQENTKMSPSFISKVITKLINERKLFRFINNRKLGAYFYLWIENKTDSMIEKEIIERYKQMAIKEIEESVKSFQVDKIVQLSFLPHKESEDKNMSNRDDLVNKVKKLKKEKENLEKSLNSLINRVYEVTDMKLVS